MGLIEPRAGETPQPHRGVWGYLALYLKGVAMGTADVVPGVSGGTIALLVGVYQELIDAIKTLGSGQIRCIFRRGGLRDYWRRAHGAFLIFLLAGIATAVLLLSKVIVGLIGSHPVCVWSFFFGLILASVWLVSRKIAQWTWKTVLLLAVGVAVGYLISTSPVATLPDGALFYFLSGAVAICAMILPGISGSFILLLLGKYTAVMTAVHQLQWGVLIPFGLGAVVGLLSFSHLLSWLLRRFYSLTVAMLTGFMGGAIIRVWPWQLAGDAACPMEHFVSPSRYAAEMGSAEVLPAVALAAAGVAIVVLLERLLSRHQEKGV